MALNGDDEIEILLSQMGGGARATDKARTLGVTSEMEKNKKEHPHKRRKTKQKKDEICGKSTFAETRLTQNPFEWPCFQQTGDRRLVLGSGLAHDCNGYLTSDKDGKYGSSSCRSCGKSSATHELCISASETSKDNHDDGPFSVESIASMITSARNARCLMAEYYPNKESGKHLLPPINSNPSSPKLIISKLDSQVGRLLSRIKKMENSRASLVLISSRANSLREKVSELIDTTMAYKEAIKAVCSPINTASSGIALIESRLAALSCIDDVYHRCYYACFFLGDKEDLNLLIPHPPTYFTCPGLAWDAKISGAASLGVFLGVTDHDEHSSISSLVAPLDDPTKELLLNSWSLKERLTSSPPETKKQSNPLFILWQSRFLESIRHHWTTKYAFVKSSVALKEALHMRHKDDSLNPLARHESYAISPEVETWRGSVRDYPANLYAYAVPTPKALEAVLEVLHRQRSIIEAGAGTGYWTALIASNLKQEDRSFLLPYDISPPRQSNAVVDVASNEYHGQVPTFIDIDHAHSFEQAQSMLPSNVINASLLLCYPPPDCDMAANALSQYIAGGGQIVLHIGEWQGLTGDKTFESTLLHNFRCEEKDVIPLPIWGSDASYLTIWRKKSIADSETSQSFSSAIGYCSASKCTNLATRRCRFARCLQYCSSGCHEKNFTSRQAIFAIHMIHLSSCNELNFEDDNHFMSLGSLDENKTQSRKKRKKKKSRHKK